MPLIAELAVASISGDVGQSARQVEALKDICACFEQLPKVPRTIVSLKQYNIHWTVCYRNSTSCSPSLS